MQQRLKDGPTTQPVVTAELMIKNGHHLFILITVDVGNVVVVSERHHRDCRRRRRRRRLHLRRPEKFPGFLGRNFWH